jgi:hypothetical protein
MNNHSITVFLPALVTRALLLSLRISLILALALVIVPRADAGTNGTPVYFSLRQLTGLPKTDRFMLIPDTRQNPVTDGTHLFGGFSLTIQTRGGQVTTNLQPIGYTLAVPGWSRTLHLVIPDTTNLVNAVNCITNGLGSYNSATVLGLQSVSTSNSASVTFTGNGTSTNPLVATAAGDGSGLTGIPASGVAGGALTNSVIYFNHGVFAVSAYAEINGEYFSTTPPGGMNYLSFYQNANLYSVGRRTAGTFGAGWYFADVSSAILGFATDQASVEGVVFSGLATFSTNSPVMGPSGSVMVFTNAAGSPFRIIVNGATNGFTFVPVP